MGVLHGYLVYAFLRASLAQLARYLSEQKKYFERTYFLVSTRFSQVLRL
jgi:hypothetical protein